MEIGIQLRQMRDSARRERDEPQDRGSAGPFGQFQSRGTLEAGLLAEACEHRAVRHPYLEALRTGSFSNMLWALRDFALHYYGYSAHFGRYLTVTISRLEDPRHRQALMDNCTEESGCYDADDLDALEQAGIQREWIEGVPHPALFSRFREALGLHGTTGIDGVEVSCWRDLFYATLSQGSALQAIGALGFGTEAIVSRIYDNFTQALARTDLAARDTVFFPLHGKVDDQHHETMMDIARDLYRGERDRKELEEGMRKALFLRAAFWDFLLSRVRDHEAGKLQ